MPRLRKKNPIDLRTALLERKKKPKMPSRRNEKPLMLVILKFKTIEDEAAKHPCYSAP